MRQFTSVIRRDLSVYLEKKSTFVMAIAFFLIISALLPIGIGPNLDLLELISPGLLWIAFLLSILLNISHAYEGDYRDGSLDLLIVESDLPELVLISKIISFWLLIILPVIIFLPVGGIMLNMQPNDLINIIILIIVSSPCMILIASIGSAIAIRINNSGLLVTLLVTPFYVPILIIGTLPFVENDIVNFTFFRSLMLLGAATLFTLAIIPFLVAYILRVNSE
jgi:heme exporter protein B